MQKYQGQQSGMVIVLAILIVAAVLATAVAFGNLVVREIRQTRLIDQSMQAYYFAESGSERALHQVRKREGVVDCNDLDGGSDATCEANGRCSNVPEAPCVNMTGEGLGEWNVVAFKEPETKISLSEGQTFQVDLFDISQTANSNIDQISITSSMPGQRFVGELTNLTNILGIIGNCSDSSVPPVIKDFIIPPVSIVGLGGKDIISECSYIFKLNYLSNNDGFQDATDITIQVFDSGSTRVQLDIPSRLIIDTNAIFGDSFQSIRVKTPIRPPLSGLYDFVIFSEESLEKF